MTDPFPSAFQELLRQILRRAPELRAAREADQPGRRRALGQSGTFAGHRDYSAGDDLRLVDWNAYARSGELFLKLLEEEERRTVTLCLDCSPSMASGTPDRLVGALRLAAILGGLGLTRLDGVRIAGGPEPWAFQGAGQVSRLLEVLASVRPRPQDPVELVRAPLVRGWQGTLLWISDFAEPDRAEPGLRLLRRRGLRCRGWLPSLPSDTVPDLDGWVWLDDPETGAQQAVEVDAALRRAMRDELRTLARHQDSVFSAVGYPLLRFPLPAADDFRLASWFRLPWTGL